LYSVNIAATNDFISQDQYTAAIEAAHSASAQSVYGSCKNDAFYGDG